MSRTDGRNRFPHGRDDAIYRLCRVTEADFLKVSPARFFRWRNLPPHDTLKEEGEV